MLGSGAIIVSGSLGLFSGCRDAAPLLDLPDSILDTIIPRDDYPGAIDLGLNKKLRGWLNKNERRANRFKALLETVSHKAHSLHQRPFNSLSVDQRETLLTSLLDRKNAGNNQNALRTRSTLLRVRRQIMTWYYGSIEGQRSIGYQLPSQLRLKFQNTNNAHAHQK